MTDRQINDGGPAFPLPVADQECFSRFESGYGGMSLRDYFAAKAMAALIAEPVSELWQGTAAQWANQLQHTQLDGPSMVAHVAYMMADAMLKARGVHND